MAFLNIQYHSESLQKASSMQVILPESAKKPYPVMYLLHGLSDDHTIWHRRTRIEWYVRELPMAVVMPDGGRGFYCDALNGPAHESHIIKDVVNFVDRHFNTRADRSGRVLGDRHQAFSVDLGRDSGLVLRAAEATELVDGDADGLAVEAEPLAHDLVDAFQFVRDDQRVVPELRFGLLDVDVLDGEAAVDGADDDGLGLEGKRHDYFSSACSGKMFRMRPRTSLAKVLD